MFYTVYKVTNTLNGMFYVGCHKTMIINDDYLGSGKYLKRAIRKYGRKFFHKEILFVFDTAKEMFDKEKEIVSTEMINHDMSYNLCIGGSGGFDYINRTLTQEQLSIRGKHARKFSSAASNSPRTDAWNMKVSLSKSGKPNGWKGKKHSDETKAKIKANKLPLNKEANGMFNKKWINDGTQNMLISKDDVSKYAEHNFILGKIKNFTKNNKCKCGNIKLVKSNLCNTCSGTTRTKHSDEDIMQAWQGCDRIVDVAIKLGYHNPNNIGATAKRIKSLKP